MAVENFDEQMGRASLLNQESYTSSSWEMFDPVYQESLLFDVQTTSADEINNLTSRLKQAIDNLKTQAFAELQMVINQVEAMNYAYYTFESLNTLQIELDKAKVLADSVHNIPSLQNALTNLTTAKNNLVYEVDPQTVFNQLQTKITEGNGLIKENYTDSTWTTFAVSLNTAKLVTIDDSIDVIDEALTSLTSEMNELKTVAYETLQNKIKEAELIQPVGYSAASYQNLVDEVTVSKQYLDTTSNIPYMQQAVDEIELAIQSLVSLASSTSIQSLQNRVNELKALDTSIYETGVDELNTAIQNAENVLMNAELTETDINIQLQSLQTAQNGLKLPPQPNDTWLTSAEATSQGFVFDLATNSINGYTGTNTDIIIPSHIDGTPITTIGQSAFFPISSNASLGKSSVVLTSVVLPITLTTIGNDGFRNNTIKKIIIPSKLNNLGTYAFGNGKLENVIFEEGVNNVYTTAFRTNEISSIQFPSTMGDIGLNAFKTNKLTTVALPASATYTASGLSSSFDTGVVVTRF